MRIVLAKEKNLFEVNELIKKINLNVERRVSLGHK